MNIFFFYVIYRFIKEQSWNFLTFGIFGINEKTSNQDTIDTFKNPALISFAWHFIVTLLLIILFANIEVTISHNFYRLIQEPLARTLYITGH